MNNVAIAEDDDRLHFIPLSEAGISPGGVVMHIKDQWWCAHPEKGLVFFKIRANLSPQCCRDRRIAEEVYLKLFPWAEVVFVESVFQKIRLQDYYV